jgi:carbamoyltransferase
MGKRYYGIHCECHDANVTILDENGNLEFFAQSERFSPRLKVFPYLTNIKDFFPKPKEDDIICVHTSFYSQGTQSESFKDENPLCVQKINFAPNSKSYYDYWLGYEVKPNFVVSHHLSHILSSWAFRPNDDLRFCMGCDGAGFYANGLMASCIGGFINENGFKLVELTKSIPSSVPLTEILGNNSAGKAMGAAGYFVENKNISNEQFENFIQASFSRPQFHRTEIWHVPNFAAIGRDNDPKTLNLIGIFYEKIIEEIWKCCEINLKNFIPNKNIGVVVGGGTHLALELNTKISTYAKDFVFGPPINDSGLSLGEAVYAYYLDTGKWPPALTSPSIMHLQDPLPQVGPQEPKEIAKLIANNKVVGLLRGKAECGPRSLGFRSILADAGKYENLKRVSVGLKGREYYRPLAPMVTAEAFDRYFTGPKGEYMQYKCECSLSAKLECPAIVHKDNSSRPQVVYKEKDPWLHELLVEYGKITGRECLINTSLNGPGKPICNTYNDALEDFENKDIQLVSIKSTQ